MIISSMLFMFLKPYANRTVSLILLLAASMRALERWYLAVLIIAS